MTHYDVAHKYFHDFNPNKSCVGSGNLWYDGTRDTINSYSATIGIADRENKILLYSANKHSKTTAKHIDYVLSACPYTATIAVIFDNRGWGYNIDKEDTEAHYNWIIKDSYEKLLKARERKEYYFREINRAAYSILEVRYYLENKKYLSNYTEEQIKEVVNWALKCLGPKEKDFYAHAKEVIDLFKLGLTEEDKNLSTEELAKLLEKRNKEKERKEKRLTKQVNELIEEITSEANEWFNFERRDYPLLDLSTKINRKALEFTQFRHLVNHTKLRCKFDGATILVESSKQIKFNICSDEEIKVVFKLRNRCNGYLENPTNSGEEAICELLSCITMTFSSNLRFQGNPKILDSNIGHGALAVVKLGCHVITVEHLSDVCTKVLSLWRTHLESK
jgi:hypothetical protein